MKLKSIILSAAAAATLATGAAADTVKMGIATEAYPPFSTPDAAGNYTGWEIEIIDAICAEAKLDCEIVDVAWDGIIPSLVEGKIDVIAASMSITEERLKVIDFSNKYYQSGASLITAKGAGIEASAAGVAGKTIGVQSGTIHQAYALAHFGDATLREYQTQDEANQDLFAGRIDGTMADALALDEFLLSAEGQACCENAGVVPEDTAIHGLGIGFGMRQGSDELKATLNAAIDGIRASGKYDEISAGYFNFNIYGD